MARDAQEEDDPGPRLRLTEPTIKELFARSGNLCAFPGCRHPVIDELGNVVAQVIHIKGVRPLASRFDKSQTPEERRHPSNLMIMCWAHHRATDDEVLYPTARMVEIKANHERRFGGLVAGLHATFEDQTVYTAIRPPTSMERYRAEYGLSDEEVAETQANLVRMQEQLASLPPDARSVVATIVERGEHAGENIYEMPIAELRDVLAVTEASLGEQLATLKHNGFVDIDAEQREGYHPAAAFVFTPHHFPGTGGAPDLDELKRFAEMAERRVAQVIIELDFDIFG